MSKKSEPKNILIIGQRQSGETKKAVIACNDYLRMGPGRSLAKLRRRYAEDTSKYAITVHLRTLQGWSAKYGWVKRAEEYDTIIEQEKTTYAEEMMKSGLALDYERVAQLKELFDLLFKELHEKSKEGVLHNLWLPDVKSIGSGENAERVDIERYNSPIISDIRGLLDDLAKETGGRVQKKDVTSGGKELQVIFAGNVDPEEI